MIALSVIFILPGLIHHIQKLPRTTVERQCFCVFLHYTPIGSILDKNISALQLAPKNRFAFKRSGPGAKIQFQVG